MLGTSGSSGERSAPVTAKARGLAALHQRDRRRPVGNREQALLADHAQVRTRCCSCTGIATRRHAGLELEQFAGNGEGRRRRAVVRFVGIGLGPGHQFLHGLGRMIVRHHQHQRERRDHVERDEALGRMIVEIGIDRGGDRHLPGGADQHGVAVGRLMRGDIRRRSGRRRPTLFSMTVVAPVFCWNLFTTRRANRSLPPPAAKPTMKWMARLG